MTVHAAYGYEPVIRVCLVPLVCLPRVSLEGAPRGPAMRSARGWWLVIWSEGVAFAPLEGAVMSSRAGRFNRLLIWSVVSGCGIGAMPVRWGKAERSARSNMRVANLLMKASTVSHLKSQ